MKIFFVGLSGVPYFSRACDIRLKAFAELFIQNNCNVTVLNRYSPKDERKVEINDSEYEIIELISHKNSSCLNLFWLLLSILKEFCYLLKYRFTHRDEQVLLHLYTGHYIDMLFYWLIAKICDYKIVYQYVEYRSEHSMGKRNLYHRINSYFCDYKGAKLWDGVIPISEFLKNKSLNVNNDIKYMKVTPLCDFQKFESNVLPCDIKEKFLLFCGSIDYQETIKIIIDSYKKSRISNICKLVLVISGSTKEVNQVRMEYSDLVILTKLDYEVLVSYYKHAYALFIPLKPISCEIARFPNKVCEYLASHGLVITTDVGEMKYFFKDGENAIVAPEFTVEAMSKRLDKLADSKYDVYKIKANAYSLGKQNFDQQSYKLKLSLFISNLFK